MFSGVSESFTFDAGPPAGTSGVKAKFPS